MKSIRLPLIPALLLMLLLLFSPPALAVDQPQDDLSLSRYYIGLYSYFQPGDEVMKASSLEQMIAAMQDCDPYFDFLSAEEIAAMDSVYAGSYVGIGVLMETDAAGEIVIKAVYADTVAARAGFRAGDILYSVDGQRLQGKSLSEARALLAGEGIPDSMAIVTIKRDNWTETYNLARKSMKLPSVSYWMLAEGVAYLHIERFTVDTAAQMESGLNYLRELGMRSLVLDLRACPGGVLYTAADTAELFLDGGPIYFSINNRGVERMHYMASGLEKSNAPLAVLIDSGTASAAELLAAVLQDEGRGYLIGMPSFGKGYYQSLLTLPSGNGLYLTTGKYVSSGQQDVSLQHGLTPDLLVRAEAEPGADAQLNAALNWLKGRQAVPYQVVYTVGSTAYVADGQAEAGAVAPFIREGSCYLPAGAVLSRLGWSMEWRGGLCYAQNGARRLILDPAHQQALSGNQSADTYTVNNNVYLPAAFFRQLGYSVDWDAAARSVKISR